ncbi:hypothetical protein IID10_22300 [candidate division KSB1 bacterium]|nr:hypothetical protein [candidate division KSB1 bacterium]
MAASSASLRSPRLPAAARRISTKLSIFPQHLIFAYRVGADTAAASLDSPEGGSSFGFTPKGVLG